MEKAVVPEPYRGEWAAHQRERIRECAETPGYERTYVYVLWDGRPDGHSLTPQTADWLRTWNV
jgi:hypothetical protein